MAIYCSNPSRPRWTRWPFCLDLMDKMEPTCKGLGERNSKNKCKIPWLHVSPGSVWLDRGSSLDGVAGGKGIVGKQEAEDLSGVRREGSKIAEPSCSPGTFPRVTMLAPELLLHRWSQRWDKCELASLFHGPGSGHPSHEQMPPAAPLQRPSEAHTQLSLVFSALSVGPQPTSLMCI